MKVRVPERNPVDLRAPKKRSRQGQVGQIKIIVEACSEYAEPKGRFIVIPGQPLRHGWALIEFQQPKIAQARA
jgi:hypothetical protein